MVKTADSRMDYMIPVIVIFSLLPALDKLQRYLPQWSGKSCLPMYLV
jgi:hypothetical protein